MGISAKLKPMSILPFLTAFFPGLLLIPLVRRLSIRLNRVAEPRPDRWHSKPTATLGGIGITLAFCLGLLGYTLVSPQDDQHRALFLLAPAIMFCLGLVDDLKRLSPQAKLAGQILITALVISLGYRTEFFTPRIANPILAQVPNVLLTFVWLVGITNAINLLDNMDGLAGGIALIAAVILAYFFYRAGDVFLLAIALSLAGSLLAFLVFNFPPASIFMGDSGSLFLGFTLALLAIARQPQASNVLAVMGVPILLFLLPILDTALVTFTRLLRGQSPMQGGRDHTSHRLIAFGLSERQAVLALYLVALISGSLAAVLESIQYWYSLVLVPLLVITMALLVAYLGGLKVLPAASNTGQPRPLTKIFLDLTFRRHLLEVLLDFTLISLAFYLAILTTSGIALFEKGLSAYLNALPAALGSAYLAFFAAGVYRGVWRYVDLRDMLRFFQAALGAVVLLLAFVYLASALGWNTLAQDLPLSIYLLFPIFLFSGLSASRSSFRLLDLIKGQQPAQGEERVVIIGAGDAGEMALRWIQMNPHFHLRPLGLLDDDPLLQGRIIHGVTVVGTVSQLERMIGVLGIQGVILAEGIDASDIAYRVRLVCLENGCWIRRLRLEFEEP